ncbi:YqzE family protein [Priestia abyssalis]|uniref:YqzE family protein n=1 Tax=Priestia abyssalis TaxID=1221450 RepID=UPI0003FEE9D0|nr:YqzE family protein [Priestia abyssalis]MDQ0244418.1 hypothetical protein [Bacillus fengqiuensis]
MSTNDYVKFVTQQFVRYIDKPKEERKQQRRQRKEERDSFVQRWFGVIPFAVMMWYRKKKE